MQGSITIKALILSLQGIFDQCRECGNEGKPPAFDLTIQSIKDYVSAHNSNESVKLARPIGSELFNIYAVYIDPAPALELEILFLSVLELFVPVLEAADIDKWLRTFLGCAVDSAGLDREFVRRSRMFILSILLPMHTLDQILARKRTQIAERCCENLFQILVATDEALPAILGISHETTHSQKHYERLRYIRANTSGLMRAHAKAQPSNFYVLANNHLQEPTCRSKIIFLAATLVTDCAAGSHIVSSGFWKSMLQCALRDTEITVVLSLVNYICMVLPLIAMQLAPYISDLLLIFLRTSMWSSMNFGEVYETHSSMIDTPNGWKIAKSFTPQDSSSATVVSRTASTISRLIYLGTLIYGLFPYTICKFNINPLGFLHEHAPAVMSLTESLQLLRSSSCSSDLNIQATRAIKTLFHSVAPHPKLLVDGGRDIKLELDNPLKWIKQEHGSTDLNIVTLALVDMQIAPFSDIKAAGISRKASIVATNSDSESSKTDLRKTLLLPATSTHSQSSGEAQTTIDDTIGRLLDDHAKLFSLKHDGRRSPSPSVESTDQSYPEKQNYETGMGHGDRDGTQDGKLQFYQRELLLQKNELEFVTYMSGLYKSRINDMNAVLEHPQVVPLAAQDDVALIVKDLEQEFRAHQLKSEAHIDELASSLKQILESYEREHTLLVAMQEQRQNEKHSLEIMLESVVPEKDLEIARLSHELANTKSMIADAKPPSKDPNLERNKDELREKDALIYRLTEKIQSLNSEYARLAAHASDLELKIDQAHARNREIEQDQNRLPPALSEIVEGYQRQIGDLKAQVAQFERVMEKQNLEIVQLSSMQPIPIPQKAHSEVFDRASTRSGSDRGVEWGDKTEAIVGAPPRRGGSKFGASYMSSGFGADSEHNSQSSTTSAPVASRQTAKPVIIMGRGGYQKRSKNFM